MKRSILLTVMVCIAAPLWANGTVSSCALAGQRAARQECSYVATGPGALVHVTPDAWEIYVVRDEGKVVLLDHEAGAAGQGINSFPSRPGETVHVALDASCSDAGCGSAGFIFVSDWPRA